MPKTTNDTLVLVEVDGHQTEVRNGYDGIKGALGQRPFDYVRGSKRFGAYIDDEGLFLGLALNVPVSLMLRRAVYGPAVCCHGDPDDEGDTLPVDDEVRAMLALHCENWRYVMKTAQMNGQDPLSYANGDTVPPPEIIPLPDGMSIEQALQEYGYVITLDEM